MSTLTRWLCVSTFVMAVYLSVDAAPSPFFDAIYEALNGNGRRYSSYGYNGYNGYEGYNNGYNYGGYGYQQPRRPVETRRQEKSYRDICRVHFPDAQFGQVGAAGVVCPS